MVEIRNVYALEIINFKYRAFFNNTIKGCWGSEMAQRVKGLSAKIDDLSLIPGTSTVEGENLSLNAVL